jgi:hypothetical protein
MNFEKKYLADIFKCYAVSSVKIDGKINLVFAGEGDGSMHIFSGEGFETQKTLWEGGGGTMSISPIPEKEGYFLASRGFTSMVDAQGSHVVIVRYKDGQFTHDKIVDLPFLHRFDMLKGQDGTNYFLGASIANYKENKEDWSHPGKLFVGQFPSDWDSEIKLDLSILKDGLTINHGYSKGEYKGCEAGFVGATEGIFAIVPPKEKGGEWTVEQLMDTPTSDMAVMDIDGDGELEIAAISPFHGDQFKIYKKIDGEYKEVYKYPVYQNFYHAVEGCTFKGKPAFLGGARRNRMQIFVITYDEKTQQFIETVVDEGVGPSNLAVASDDDGEIIISANRQIGHAAIYYVR